MKKRNLKFKVGDLIYWQQPEEELEYLIPGKVIEVNPDGYGWLKWVTYIAEFGPKKYKWYLGDEGSPDVFCSTIYTEDEYNLAIAKQEYEEICDHGNGD